MEDHLKPLDDIITNKFLPALFGGKINEKEREMFTLPIKLGGMGMPLFTEKAPKAYQDSKTITSQLV